MENFFTMPAIYLLQALLQYAPGVAAFIGVSDPADSIGLVIILALLCWILGVAGCWAAVMLVRNAFRISEAIVRTFWHRTVQAAGSVRTWLICKYRSLLPKQSASSMQTAEEAQFDDFDLTVLRAAAERGPGFSTSAGELAGKYSLRPSRLQKTLGKLNESNMLTTVIGSTDGFDNYRITDYGAAYLRSWQQRKAS